MKWYIFIQTQMTLYRSEGCMLNVVVLFDWPKPCTTCSCSQLSRQHVTFRSHGPVLNVRVQKRIHVFQNNRGHELWQKGSIHKLSVESSGATFCLDEDEVCCRWEVRWSQAAKHEHIAQFCVVFWCRKMYCSDLK